MVRGALGFCGAPVGYTVKSIPRGGSVLEEADATRIAELISDAFDVKLVSALRFRALSMYNHAAQLQHRHTTLTLHGLRVARRDDDSSIVGFCEVGLAQPAGVMAALGAGGRGRRSPPKTVLSKDIQRSPSPA